MSIRGSFEIFSLPELFQIIDLGSKSGRLIVQVLAVDKGTENKGPYYLWFDRGRLVALTNRFNHRGLIELIEKQGWLSQLITQKLDRLCPTQTPLGDYLEKMKLLKAQQLGLLFQMQLHQVYQLFSLSNGWFRFDETSSEQNEKEVPFVVSWLEMTGKSMSAVEITLHALRVLEKWEHFSEQLPEPSSTLEQLIDKPNLQLSLLEWQVWKLSNKEHSLGAIATELNESLAQIQKVAFRLMVTGMVEEIPGASYNSTFAAFPQPALIAESIEKQDRQQQASPKSSFSDSFFPNLLNFLRSLF